MADVQSYVLQHAGGSIEMRYNVSGKQAIHFTCGGKTVSISIEPLDRYEDERGWVSEVYSGELAAKLQNIHLGTMEPGAVRGNHAHLESKEWIVFHDPLIHVRWQEDDEILDAVTEEPTIITLPEDIPHAFKNESDDTVSFTAYRNTRYDEDNPDAEEANLF